MLKALLFIKKHWLITLLAVWSLVSKIIFGHFFWVLFLSWPTWVKWSVLVWLFGIFLLCLFMHGCKTVTKNSSISNFNQEDLTHVGTHQC